MEKSTVVQERIAQMSNAVAQLKTATEKMASTGLAKAVANVDKAWLMLVDELWPPPKPVVDPAWVENHIKEVRALIEVNGYPVDVHGMSTEPDGEFCVRVRFEGEGVLCIPTGHGGGTTQAKEHYQRMSQEISLLKDDARDGG